MNAAAPPALVVGTGFGCRVQVPALRAAGFTVVGLVGTDAARTAERAAANAIPQAFTDLDQAIAKTGAVAVAIASPPHTHGPLTLTAVSRGCHVLCEKPFAKDTAEARAMLQAVERARVAHLVGHEFRWAPARATVARIIAEGLIGEPRFVTLTSLLPFLMNAKMPAWWYESAAGGGWLGAQGSHMIDCVRMWLGDFASVSAALPTFGPQDRGVEDSYIARFRLASGVEGVFQQSAAAWGPGVDVTRILGTRGAVWIDKGAVWIADQDGAREVPVAADLALPPIPPLSDDPRYKERGWQMTMQVEIPAYVRLCEAWRAMIDGRKPSTAVALPTFVDGLKEMEVMDAMRSSAANDGALVKIG